MKKKLKLCPHVTYSQNVALESSWLVARELPETSTISSKRNLLH